MAKIRGFKPDIWTDEGFVELSPFARLLWMGMWNFACDNGHLADKPKQIKMRVLPTDDVNVSELLREIHSQGLIERTDGWITVPNLSRHQKVDRRYFTTCDKTGCEEPPETVSQRESRRAPVVPTPSARRAHTVTTTGALGDGDSDGDVEVKGNEGDGEGDGEVKAARKRAARPIPENWQPNTKHHQYATERNLDLNREASSFRNHALTHDRRCASWNAAFTNWLAKAYPPKTPTKSIEDRRADGEYWL